MTDQEHQDDRAAELRYTRYEIRTGNHPNGTFGVWDNSIQCWQVFKRTRADAESWITVRTQQEAWPKEESTLRIRMPARD